MLILQNITYIHPNNDLLFEEINLTVNKHDKIALIGNNGSGKSTLLKIAAGVLKPSNGTVNALSQPYFVPQLFGQYNHLSIAQALQIESKLQALREILNGNMSVENYELLDEDWMIEERCQQALVHWQLADLDLSAKMESLSGGQKTKVFLAGIAIHQPELILLDEPSNHLDSSGRQLLYDFIQSSKSTVVIVSHDRTLLNLLNTVSDLTRSGIQVYGGNYDFYVAQKQVERNALSQDIHSKEKALRKAKEKERETRDRQQKLDVRAQKNLAKAGLPKIVANTLRNSAENSSSKIKAVHAEKVGDIAKDLQDLRSSQVDISKMKFGFDDSSLHKGKILFDAVAINFDYGKGDIWQENLDLRVKSGERLALKGNNGSGKTTLIKIILGELEPTSGTAFRAGNRSVYIDQDYSLIDNTLNVYEQAQQHNSNALQEHEIKIRLNRFLFTYNDWNKPCSALSGGERMRLILCSLTIGQTSPDIIVMDEPTNNLDIQNIEILTAAINDYQGTLIVVSHDDTFLQDIHVQRTVLL